MKEVFPALSADEVGKMLKAKNSGVDNKKPKINMMTREPSRREVIIPMTKVNAELIVNSAHIYISNVNNCLKIFKSNIIADSIWINVNGIVITTNKLANNWEILEKCQKYQSRFYWESSSPQVQVVHENCWTSVLKQIRSHYSWSHQRCFKRLAPFQEHCIGFKTSYYQSIAQIW